MIPIVASGVMGVSAYGIYRLCSLVLGNMVSTLFAILIAVLVYFVLLIKLRGVNAKEMRGMPGGTRLLQAARKLHLM